jgi:hypothetical protein
MYQDFGLPAPVGADLAIVDASRYPIVVRAGLAEVGLHEFNRLIAHVEAGVEAERVHLRGRRRTDAVELADRQLVEQSGYHAGQSSPRARESPLSRATRLPARV